MKTKILSILALLLMTVTQGAWAQETLTVYDGTADNQFIPMYGLYFNNYTKSECIIPASELTAMEGGTITAITFYAQTIDGSNPTFGSAKQQVFLKEVSGTTLDGFSGMTGATVVFDGTLPMPTTSTDGYTITFSQGYTYNGGNLLIGIYNAATGSWKRMRWYGIDNQSSGVSAYGASSDNLANAAFKPQTFLPKTKFTYTPAPDPVDLGLPSGKKWANRNVGAGSETGYGTYYAWSSSDIATAQWGVNWRMPTLTEAQELINNTDHEWATIGGVNGMKYMKKTDNSVYIFVPAAGINGNNSVGSTGVYWTSTEANADKAYELYLNASETRQGTDVKTYQFPIRPVQMFAGEGTEASPYLIASTTDWNNLSAAVNGGETYSGKYFKMTANVGTVSTIVGTSVSAFNGTFDGNGHTLDVNISNSNADTRTAPFAWAGGSAVIKNLHVTGSLTNTARTSGIVGSCNATTQISSCRVSATISGGNHTSGISISGGQITNCLFDGKINGTASTAGFATYVADGTKITNCLFKPQDGSSIPSNQGCFYASESGKTPTLTKCYYTSTAGGTTAQGTDGSGMTAAQLVENLGPSNWKVVDGNAIPKVHPGLSGLGTQASPYLIASTTDWNNLVSAVNAGETYSGNYFKMTANVGTVSTWMTGTFSGNFDGDGNTLTVGYSQSGGDYCAPFGYMSGATVENLKVAGTISSSSGYRQASIGGRVANSTIRKCTSSVAFTLSQGDWVECGGLVANLVDNTTLTMTGCAFTGSITYSNATGYAGGGLIGWLSNGCTVTLTDCVFAPSAVTFAKESGLRFYMFADIPSGDHTLTLNNCYYNGTAACNEKITKQDGTMQMHTIAAGNYVSSLSVTKGSATATYDVSGITVYSGGIDFNDGSTTTFYGGSGQSVSLALTAETRTGYQFKQYAASQGTLSDETTNTPTLTMPTATGETLYTTYTATAGPDGTSDKSGYAKLVDNDKLTKVCATFTSGVYIDFNTPNAIVPTGYVITTANDASSEYWRNRSPKTWKLYGKLNEGDSWTVLDDVADGNLPNEDTTDKSYSIANTAAYKYFRYEITAIKGSTELFQLAELQLKGYDAVVISAEYDPTYNANFASGNDNDGWTIDPTQQIAGGTVTVSYMGENKVKSVTVAPKGALTGKFSVSSTEQVQFSKGNLQYVGTWQFAANQYDIFGVSQSDDHRDLFGWGTKTNPNNTSETNGDYSWAEWGENTITNGCTGWRTLTKDEWGYLFTDRANASTLRTFATVNNVTGLILMPDGWTASGVSLTITTANYTTNVLSTSQWATLEKQGCVFLPAAGGRAGTNVVNVGSIGDYWSSDASGDTNAYDLNFSNNCLLPQNTAGQRHYGWSVRLVRDVE